MFLIVICKSSPLAIGVVRSVSQHGYPKAIKSIYILRYTTFNTGNSIIKASNTC